MTDTTSKDHPSSTVWTGPAMAWAERDALIGGDDGQLERACDVEFVRSRGPGGQHRNKVSSGVRAKHRQTGVEVTATERRSQHENRRVALDRMRLALAVGVRSPARDRGDLPADLADQLGRDHWQKLSAKNVVFRRLAACVLDVLAAEAGRLSEVGRRMDVSTGSLVKFLAIDSDVWQAAARIRSAAGLGPLRK